MKVSSAQKNTTFANRIIIVVPAAPRGSQKACKRDGVIYLGADLRGEKPFACGVGLGLACNLCRLWRPRNIMRMSTVPNGFQRNQAHREGRTIVFLGENGRSRQPHPSSTKTQLLPEESRNPSAGPLSRFRSRQEAVP